MRITSYWISQPKLCEILSGTELHKSSNNSRVSASTDSEQGGGTTDVIMSVANNGGRMSGDAKNTFDICFIDYTKAFDRDKHDMLFEI